MDPVFQFVALLFCVVCKNFAVFEADLRPVKRNYSEIGVNNYSKPVDFLTRKYYNVFYYDRCANFYFLKERLVKYEEKRTARGCFADAV